MRPGRFWKLSGSFAAGASSAIGGLGLSRLLFELFFPRAVWLGTPAAALGMALLAAGGGWLLGGWLARRGHLAAALALSLPLLLNVPAVLQPQSATLLSRLLFVASLWLAAAVGVALWQPVEAWRKVIANLLLLAAALLPIFLATMGQTVGRADTFEFQVVIPKLGIVHPTGYPLYLLLGKLFTFIPLGSMAWRINLASVLFGVVAAGFVFLFVWEQTRRALAALLAALIFALGPTFWSQAIEAEVYALHAVVVGGVLWGIGRLASRHSERSPWSEEYADWRLVLLFLAVGLGLANHLTTVVLLPGVALATWFVGRADGRRRTADGGEILRFEDSAQNDEGKAEFAQSHAGVEAQFSRPRASIAYLLALLAALLLPLLLYAYLPIRWAAVNGEAMGLGRFVDWVIGGRFQGALQLDAFLTDPARYQVVARLILAEWRPPVLLFFSAVGFLWLARHRRRLALILGVTLLGFLFYGLSYYVPDLAVFLLPAHLILALLWGIGAGALLGILARGDWHLGIGVAIVVGLMGLIVWGAAERWEMVDRSQADGGLVWARAALAMPLDTGAAILADSERFPPLYYLQQAEGVRPDLEIMVLPDEAAYRAELGARLAAGQTVYLARYLPGLAGQYHLRSVGPLVEVGQEPLLAAPPDLVPSDVQFDGIRLLGLAVEAAPQERATAVTFYWQADEATTQPLLVYTRWDGEGYTGAPIPAGGQHPANNSYPTVAWDAGEVTPDYHVLPHPPLGEIERLALQVALAPQFSAAEALAWQTAAVVTVTPPERLPQGRALYAQVDGALLDGVQVDERIRPQAELPVLLSGCGEVGRVRLELRGTEPRANGAARAPGAAACDEPFVARQVVSAQLEAGEYGLWAPAASGARCHWLARASSGCRLATVAVSGAALPQGATNFGDRIALTALEVTEADVRRGGQVTVAVTWQALAAMERDYTLFVQVVDAQDRIVGQIDTWARQGTYPTSQWAVGEVVRDTYTVAITEEAPEGDYRLLLGWYLLATQERLPVLDEAGAIVEDRVVVALPD